MDWISDFDLKVFGLWDYEIYMRQQLPPAYRRSVMC